MTTTSILAFVTGFCCYGLLVTLRAAWRYLRRPRTWQQRQRDIAADLARERRAHRERRYSDLYPGWRG